MKKIFITLILACIGYAVSGQNISGTWSGELDAGLQKIPLVLHLTDGKCTLDSPQQGAKDIAAEIDFISADSLQVSISSLGAAYAARLICSAAQQSSSGT